MPTMNEMACNQSPLPTGGGTPQKIACHLEDHSLDPSLVLGGPLPSREGTGVDGSNEWSVNNVLRVHYGYA